MCFCHFRKVFTGGISTNAEFGTPVLELSANDPDFKPKLRYSLDGKIQISGSSEAISNIPPPAFLVDPKSGTVTVNFVPQKDMKGYFLFGVRVRDGAGHVDKSEVMIYLVWEDQRIRFVFRAAPNEIRTGIDRFRSELSSVTDSIVNVDAFRVHETPDGTVDSTKTDGKN